MSDRLKSLVKYVMAIGPRCFKCWMFMSSGPVDLFVFEFLIASRTSPAVSSGMFVFVFRVLVCLLSVYMFCVRCVGQVE